MAAISTAGEAYMCDCHYRLNKVLQQILVGFKFSMFQMVAHGTYIHFSLYGTCSVEKLDP